MPATTNSCNVEIDENMTAELRSPDLSIQIWVNSICRPAQSLDYFIFSNLAAQPPPGAS
jgi:hypothetical protein